MNAIFKVLAVALCCSIASSAEAPAATTITAVAAKGAEFVSIRLLSGFKVGMSFKLDDGTNSEIREITLMILNGLGMQVEFKGTLEHAYAAGTKFELYVAPKPTPPPPTTITTTKDLHWDFSASSGSSGFLGSLNSYNWFNSAKSLSSGSSSFDPSGSVSSGSATSGSSGIVWHLWLWPFVLFPVCVLCGSILAGSKKKAKKAKKSKAKKPEPVPEVVVEVPELQPLVVPSLLPMNSGFTYAAPMTTSYAAPMAQYAMPATTAYAAAPAQYTAAPYQYAQGGVV